MIAKDRERLLEGVQEIAAPGVPGPLSIFGDQAFPVIAGKMGKGAYAPVVAAVRANNYRVVAFGHNGYFGKDALSQADTGRLMENVIRWGTRDGRPAPRIAAIGLKDFVTWLKGRGFSAEEIGGANWTLRLKEFDVVCCAPSDLRDNEIESLRQFMTGGGGLVCANLGWGWLQTHSGKRITDMPGNRMLEATGILWSDGTLERTSEKGYQARGASLELTQASRALEAIADSSDGKSRRNPSELAQASASITRAIRTLSPDEKILRPKLAELKTRYKDGIVPTDKNPVTAKDPLKRLILTMQMEEVKDLPPERVTAHPAGDSFPGAIPAGAERIAAAPIEVDTSVPAWHSTGLYAAPGQIITVEAPAGLDAKTGIKVRIGAHNDHLWELDKWTRCPEICRIFPIAGAGAYARADSGANAERGAGAGVAAMTKAANAFGGPIYIEVPNNCKLGKVTLTIRNGVAAPYFVRDKTSREEWIAKIRNRPAPWAELEGHNLILTVPSEVVRTLDDPEALMKFWDDVLDADADMSARPKLRERPERMVTDRQISAGYMHAGYPIMTWLDVIRAIVDLSKLKNGRNDWGFFHELGHNHQSGDWTFAGTGEVTENLFSLYCLETVVKAPPKDFHSNCTPEARVKQTKAYFAKPPQSRELFDDPFVGLLPYQQLRDAFGWDAYKKVFAEYRALPASERPKTDEEKRDQWLIRFSKAVGKNLGPFFQTWGLKTSEKARASVANLPAWMQENFPPK
ncbi:MAG: M60 family metallopeptidase [Candidatus Sumerlaeota bacterium]|nr:M60 family metallopeptidase [Candidatus Sumerlaeota bacterium]